MEADEQIAAYSRGGAERPDPRLIKADEQIVAYVDTGQKDRTRDRWRSTSKSSPMSLLVSGAEPET